MYDKDIIYDMQERIDELVGPTKIRKEASTKNTKLKLQEKYFYDKKEIFKKFEPEDIILMWNDRIEDKGNHRKFEPI